jgi:hypothetical protein
VWPVLATLKYVGTVRARRHRNKWRYLDYHNVNIEILLGSLPEMPTLVSSQTLAWKVAHLPCKRQVVGSISARGELYPQQISFVLGTTGFLLSCPPSLFDFVTIGKEIFGKYGTEIWKEIFPKREWVISRPASDFQLSDT